MKPLKIILAFSILIFLSNCKKEKTDPIPENLITNSSFEVNGQSSFEGWTGVNPAFVNDTPEGGGDWALQLEPAWFPGVGFASISFTGFSGQFKFVLKCDAKLISNTINGGGNISLRLKDEVGTTTTLALAGVTNSEWETYTLISEIVDIEMTDEIMVFLSAGSTEVVNWQVLFDKVVLEKIEE